MEDVKEYFYVLRSFPVRIGERASFRNVRSLSLSFASLPRRYFLFCIFVFIGVAIDALINQSRMVSRVISLRSVARFRWNSVHDRTNERTNERKRKAEVGASENCSWDDLTFLLISVSHPIKSDTLIPSTTATNILDTRYQMLLLFQCLRKNWKVTTTRQCYDSQRAT